MDIVVVLQAIYIVFEIIALFITLLIEVHNKKKNNRKPHKRTVVFFLEITN